MLGSRPRDPSWWNPGEGIPLYSGGTDLAQRQRRDPLAATRAYWNQIGMAPTHAYVGGVNIGNRGLGYTGNLMPGITSPAGIPREPPGMVNPDGTMPPPRADSSIVGNPSMSSAIAGLLTPGLVPDIARQSAELSAGRGIPGSPAGASTAVRMSEQNWQQRLALANALMSGETNRALPYQITPYQQALLNLQNQELGLRQQEINNRLIPSLLNYGGFGRSFGGNRMGGGSSTPVYNTATPSVGTSIGSFGRGNFGSGPFGSDLSAAQLTSGPFGSYQGTETLDDVYASLGLGDYGSYQGTETLDDVYSSLGIGDYGSQPGDEGYEPPDFDWDIFE